jgi:hypothetical protein
MINLTDKPICMTDPKLEKPHTMMHRGEFINQTSKTKRLQLLNENLTLNHIIEGATETRPRYMGVYTHYPQQYFIPPCPFPAVCKNL